MHRIRVEFSKDGPMQFTGHLDLARAWARLLRRARLPIAYSKGFNPQARVNLAAALPLGFTSECELIDIWLDEEIEPDPISRALQKAAPPGLSIKSVKHVDLKAKTLQSRLVSIEYRVQTEWPEDIQQRIETLLNATSLLRERRGKQYDLRPLVGQISYNKRDDLVEMQLTARPGGTGRPDEVLAALGLDPLAAQIRRVKLFFTPEPTSSDPNETAPKAAQL